MESPWDELETASAFLLAESAAHWIFTKRGEDVLLLDLRGRSDVCDFFIICSGNSDVQVKAISSAVRDGLFEQGQKPLSVEGQIEARWVLLDYVDVIIHVFQPEVRQYYLLERLWGDAPQLALPEDHFATAEFRDRHPELSGAGTNVDSTPNREPDSS
ncbi:MAG: ribosome silencing factor [bacterium]